MVRARALTIWLLLATVASLAAIVSQGAVRDFSRAPVADLPGLELLAGDDLGNVLESVERAVADPIAAVPPGWDVPAPQVTGREGEPLAQLGLPAPAHRVAPALARGPPSRA